MKKAVPMCAHEALTTCWAPVPKQVVLSVPPGESASRERSSSSSPEEGGGRGGLLAVGRVARRVVGPPKVCVQDVDGGALLALDLRLAGSLACKEGGGAHCARTRYFFVCYIYFFSTLWLVARLILIPKICVQIPSLV